jgi:hypothetical protein
VFSRNYAIALIVLILSGVGTWWVLYDSDPPSGKDSYSDFSPESSMQRANPASAISPTSVVVESISTKSRIDGPQSSESEEWSTTTLKFSELEDPDPALSREVESAIQRSVDTKVDPRNFKAQSIMCRGQTCQILLVSRATPAGSVPASVVATILRELNDASIRNPSTGAQVLSTGAQVGRLTFGEIRVEKGGLVATIGFEKP